MGKYLLLILITALFLFTGSSHSPINKKELQTQARYVFSPLPNKMPGAEHDTPEKIALGKKLYFEKKLSVKNNKTCNSCHILSKNHAGVDYLPVSFGSIKRTKGTRNSPTVYNAGFHFVQFWDGRSPDLKDQAKGPILNPVEMAMPSGKAVEEKIKAVPQYQAMFNNAAMKITFDNIAEAIAAFERTLISHDKFDEFLKGNTEIITEKEAEGLSLFMKTGCVSCHSGALLGGKTYQKMGLYAPYSDTTDKGRFEVTKDPSDKFYFKVPSLRNVALTFPYFHDGKVEQLDDAVKIMAKLELNKTLMDSEAKSISKFLNTLSGNSLHAKKRR